MKAAYLVIDVSTLLIPFAFSFHKRIGFQRYWRSYLPAMGIAAALFLAWDACFTKSGVWGFNPRYLTGAYIGNLPLEEWLFFGCIPYSCVFTLYCLRLWGGRRPAIRTESAITWALIGALGFLGCWKLPCRYTSTTCLSLALLLLVSRYVFKVRWLGRFYYGWLILLAPLILVDGVLTGTGLQQPVVWYHNADTLGIRFGTIPVEDFLYGMELILLNILLFDRFERMRPGPALARRNLFGA